jgi:hypothetical protein
MAKTGRQAESWEVAKAETSQWRSVTETRTSVLTTQAEDSTVPVATPVQRSGALVFFGYRYVKLLIAVSWNLT